MARVKCFVFLLSYFPKYVYRAQVGCSSSLLMSCFIGMLFEYCLNHFDMVPLAPVITAITFVFLFYMHLFFFVSSLCINIYIIIIIIIILSLPIASFISF